MLPINARKRYMRVQLIISMGTESPWIDILRFSCGEDRGGRRDSSEARREEEGAVVVRTVQRERHE